MLKSKSPPPTERLFCPTQYWWLALLAILLMSGALRLPGYNFSLPFIDQLDEPFHNLSARMIIDFGTSQSLNTHHYPPGIVMLNYLMLRLFHDTDKPPGSVVGQVRLVSVAAGIGTTLVIALLGYHALNPAAGLTAATLYAITPVFQVLARYATAEIHVAFLAMLAIWLAMVGAVYRRPAWTTWATYALMLAVLFKYHALMLAPFILLAPLINGRACMRRVLANLARFALFLAWLVLLTPALDAFAEVPATENEARKSWVRHVTTNSERPDSLSDYLSDIVYNQTLALSSVKHPSLSFGWIGMILFAWQLDRRRRLMLAGLAVGAASWLLGVSLFGKQGGHAERFLFGQITLLVMLAGAGYALWWRAAVVVLKRFSRHGRLLASVLFATVYLALNLSNVQNSIAKTLDFTYADPRNFLAEWIDVTLAPGRYLYKNEARVLKRHWGGYEGVTQFELANFESPLSQSIESMRADNTSYGILYTFQHDQLLEDDPQDFLQQSTLLKRWEQQPDYRADMPWSSSVFTPCNTENSKDNWARFTCWVTILKLASSNQAAPAFPCTFTGKRRKRQIPPTLFSTICWMQMARLSRRATGRPCPIPCCGARRPTGMTPAKRSSVENIRLTCPRSFRQAAMSCAAVSTAVRTARASLRRMVPIRCS